MIKKIRTLFLLAFAFVAISCNDDDGGGNSGAKVTYRINPDAGLTLEQVTYRDDDGDLVTVAPPTQGNWEKEIRVARPFTATMTFNLSNPTEAPKSLLATITDITGGTSSTPLIEPSSTNTLTLTYDIN